MESLRCRLVRGRKRGSKLALLRLDAERAEIWLDGSSLVAGIKLLLASIPRNPIRIRLPR